MSVIRKTFACDWPDCKAELTIDSFYPAVLVDHYWAENYEGIWHLCPKHKHETFADLQKLIEEKFDSIGDETCEI